MKLLITGASGQLGSALIRQLKDSEHEVRMTSRSKPSNIGDFEWIYSDLLLEDGLDEVIKDVDVVIHTATSPMKHTKKVDVLAFEKLLEKLGHIKHFIYPSIIGIEHIPLYYYKCKCEAETLLKNSSIPYTIVRTTQFHSFVESLMLSKTICNRYIIPGNFKFQSVDTDDFAKHLIQIANHTPEGKTVEFGGPHIMTLKEMAAHKIHINKETRKILNFSFPGKLYKSLVEGKNTTSAEARGETTFEEYLKNQL
ncbi:NmrA family NAD(P)-binding protein [Ectobacillus sp. JY-23]|uniref:SDR family oxidoreductase n=1 Tax=Ectobacillus sp. JY-23 TaxID=2933872 RepID=UPI001FF5A7CB|nr:NAD(P)H-binding protein [Ectobacillus sp. JY-23]UOY92349.1 NmrA family NAD(P)-binding protein [Ectobacillus sp. JY-23]